MVYGLVVHGSHGGVTIARHLCACVGGGGSSVHFEVKSVDGTANPYLAMAALLAAGMEGVRTRKTLEVHGVGLPPNELSEAERASAGVTTRMPLTIEEARTALEEDEVLKGALGREFVKLFLSVNKVCSEYTCRCLSFDPFSCCLFLYFFRR